MKRNTEHERGGLCWFLLLALFAASPARAELGDNSVGMNIHVGIPAHIDAAADLGVSWVRMDANWHQIETADDVHNWAPLDAWVAAAHAAGLKVYLTLAYTPEWVPREAGSDSLFYNDAPQSSTEWVDFVNDAVGRYCAQGVTHFGIWNEPNLEHFWDGSLAQYVDRILLPGAAAVRSACAACGGTCKVLGPDIANVGDCDVYLEGVLARAGADTFDIIAHHTYQDFTETGWNIWDGDGFINVLDDQRVPGFTRKDLRQILDAAGYTGEVWITETGYKAMPIGDATEEDLQAVYVRRVLEEQLGRAWYTNSFFYEISDCGVDQPDCTIDGYGLMRATGGGNPSDRVFDADFRLKPAFAQLKSIIAAHPELQEGGQAPDCGDGVDNDDDGLVDLDDPGCADGTDDDESDDPARARIPVYRGQGLVLDGSLDDFGPDGWVALGEEDWRGDEALGAGDLSAHAAARWTPNGLWIGVEVEDDIHDNDHTPAELWLGDSLQLGFDMADDGGSAYDETDDHEINVALASGQVSTYRYWGPADADDSFSAVLQRVGDLTRYEILLPPEALPGLSLSPGQVFGFSFLVNEADGEGRAGWMEWTGGMGSGKMPGLFGELELRDETGSGGESDGGVPDGGGQDAGTMEDAGQEEDAGGGLDASDGSQEEDGSTTHDGGSGGDQGGADAGMTDGGTDPMDDSSGCGCGASAGGAGGVFVLLLLALGLGLRKR